MKKKRKRHGENSSGFGGYHGIPHDRNVTAYISLVAIAVLISIALVAFLVVRKNEPVPVKKAYFPPEQASPGIMDEGGAVSKMKEKFLAKPKVQAGIGTANLVIGKKPEAIINFDRAIEAEPMNALNYLQRGAAYMTDGEIARGTEDIERAAALDPKYEHLAVKCRTIKNLLNNANVNISPDQIKQMMAKLTPQDVQRITGQMIPPEQEVREKNVLGNNGQ